MPNNFKGFPAAGLEFLKQLENNNNRNWFARHKTEYTELLLMPAQLFVADLGEKLLQLIPQLQFDLRTNGSGSILRIHRDIRFSKDKRPYHTYLRILFWEGVLKKMKNPGIFISIDKNGAKIHTGQYRFDPGQLKTFRKSVSDDRLGSQLENAVNQLKSSADYEIGGEHYKRIPSAFDRNHPRAEYLKFNSFYTKSKIIGTEVIQSPAFIDVCFAEIKNMMPIHQWLVSIREQSFR